MKRYVRSSIDQSAEMNELVELLAKTADGKWVKVFEGITRRQADEIWKAGFATGDNRFSIYDEESKRIADINNRRR